MLTARDRAVLQFEAEHRRHAGGKEDAIRQTFGLSPTRYYQLLNLVIDKPEALEAEPMLVKRLLNARVRRVQRRASRTFDGG